MTFTLKMGTEFAEGHRVDRNRPSRRRGLMFKSTNTYWQWTSIAEEQWNKISKEKYPNQNLEPRRAGEKLTILEGAYRVPRKTVPLSWVEKGYVKEAEAEQISLF